MADTPKPNGIAPLTRRNLIAHTTGSSGELLELELEQLDLQERIEDLQDLGEWLEEQEAFDAQEPSEWLIDFSRDGPQEEPLINLTDDESQEQVLVNLTDGGAQGQVLVASRHDGPAEACSVTILEQAQDIKRVDVSWTESLEADFPPLMPTQSTWLQNLQSHAGAESCGGWHLPHWSCLPPTKSSPASALPAPPKSTSTSPPPSDSHPSDSHQPSSPSDSLLLSTPSYHRPSITPPTLTAPPAQSPSPSAKTRATQEVRDLEMETAQAAGTTTVQTNVQDQTVETTTGTALQTEIQDPKMDIAGGTTVQTSVQDLKTETAAGTTVQANVQEPKMDIAGSTTVPTNVQDPKVETAVSPTVQTNVQGPEMDTTVQTKVQDAKIETAVGTPVQTNVQDPEIETAVGTPVQPDVKDPNMDTTVQTKVQDPTLMPPEEVRESETETAASTTVQTKIQDPKIETGAGTTVETNVQNPTLIPPEEVRESKTETTASSKVQTKIQDPTPIPPQEVRDSKTEAAASTTVQTKIQDPKIETVAGTTVQTSNVQDSKMNTTVQTKVQDPTLIPPHKRPANVAARKARALAEAEARAKAEGEAKFCDPKSSSAMPANDAKAPAANTVASAQKSRAANGSGRFSKPKGPAHKPGEVSASQKTFAKPAQPAKGSAAFNQTKAKWSQPPRPAPGNQKSPSPPNGPNKQLPFASCDARNYNPNQLNGSPSNARQQKPGSGSAEANKEKRPWVKDTSRPFEKRGPRKPSPDLRVDYKEPDWKDPGPLIHPKADPWMTEWKPSKHHPRVYNTKSKWVTNKEIREAAKKHPGSVTSSDTWNHNSNPDNDPFHDIKQLIDWEGNWLPGPTHWESRRPYKGSRTFRDDIDKWMSRCERFRDSWTNEQIKAAFEDPSGCQVAPRIWATIEVNRSSLQEWWNDHRKSKEFEDDCKPFWQMYTSPNSNLLRPYEAPSDKMDDADEETAACRQNPAHRTAQGRCDVLVANTVKQKVAKQQRLVKRYEHLRSDPKEVYNIRATVPTDLIIPRGNVYLRPVERCDVDQLTALYNWHVKNSVVCSTMKPVTADFMASRITDAANADLPFIVAVGRPRNKRRDAPLAAEQVVGYAYADELESKESMYRFTCETELYVHNDWMQCNIGTALMDRLMYCLNPAYPWKGGYHMHAPKDGTNNLIYEFGGTRIIHSIVTNYGFDAEDPLQFEWTSTWMKKFGHTQVGLIPDCGIKHGKRINQAIFHIRTGTKFEKDTMY